MGRTDTKVKSRKMVGIQMSFSSTAMELIHYKFLFYSEKCKSRQRFTNNYWPQYKTCTTKYLNTRWSGFIGLFLRLTKDIAHDFVSWAGQVVYGLANKEWCYPLQNHCTSHYLSDIRCKDHFTTKCIKTIIDVNKE